MSTNENRRGFVRWAAAAVAVLAVALGLGAMAGLAACATGGAPQAARGDFQDFESIETLLAHAEDAAGAIEDDRLRQTAHVAIIEARARAGAYEEAMDAAAALESPQPRAQAYAGIATVRAEAGDFDGARAALASLRETFGDEVPPFVWDMAHEEFEKGRLEARARDGAFEEAMEIANEMKELRNQVWAYSRMAVARAQEGDAEEAAALLDLAVETGRNVLPDEERTEVHSRIAAARAQTGDQEGADAEFAKAKEIAAGIDGGNLRDFAYWVIADLQKEAGRFEDAEETAESIVDGARRTGITVRIQIARVQEFARSGAYAEAGPVVASMTQAGSRARMYSELATAQARGGDPRGAADSLALAKEALSAIERPTSMVTTGTWALSHSVVAKAMVQTGDLDGLADWWATIDDPYMEVTVLLGAVEGLVAREED